MQNVANPDRIVRLLLGALLVVLPLTTGRSIWSNTWIYGGAIAVGAVLLATAAFSFCPIYAALGWNFRRNA